jgi:phosphohistidine phosphatase
MDLFILRHGEAGKRLAVGNRDSKRPLTITGSKEIADIAKSLKNLNIKFDLIITSPLKRANQTAMIVAKTFTMENKVEDWNELRPEGKRSDLYQKVSSRFKQGSSILMVGHEPFLSELISDLICTGNGEAKNDKVIVSRHIVLKKAGLARIKIASFAPKMQGELRWLLTPRHLKKISK